MIPGSGLRCTDSTALAQGGLSALLKQSLIKVSSSCHLQAMTELQLRQKGHPLRLEKDVGKM